MLSNGEYDLHPQEHPIVDKDLRLDDFQSFEYGILNLVGIGHGFLEISLFAFLLQLVSRVSSMIDTLCTAFWVPSRAIHIIRCYPHPESCVLILD